MTNEEKAQALLKMEAELAAANGGTTRELKDWIFAEVRRLRAALEEEA